LPASSSWLLLLSPEVLSGWPWWPGAPPAWAAAARPLLLLGQQSLLSEAEPDVGGASWPDATSASTLQAREQ
jgi:hypothetical protein